MKNLLEADARRLVHQRIGSLTPEVKPKWGTMNATQMLAHCASQLRLCWGEIEVPSKKSVFGLFPLNVTMIWVMPWPKGAPTLPEMICADAENWEKENADLAAQIERFPEKIAANKAPHPIFGKLSERTVGRLAYRHLDHHLRQFGV